MRPGGFPFPTTVHGALTARKDNHLSERYPTDYSTSSLKPHLTTSRPPALLPIFPRCLLAPTPTLLPPSNPKLREPSKPNVKKPNASFATESQSLLRAPAKPSAAPPRQARKKQGNWSASNALRARGGWRKWARWR